MDTNHWLYGLDRGCMLRGLVRRCWMILLGAIVAVGMMNLALNLVWKPEYQTSATYAVMSKSGLSTTLSNMTAANEAATMMSEILQSEVMTNRLREELGSMEQVGSLSASVVGETNMLVISATAETSETAFRMIQVAMDSFDEYFSKIDSTAVLQKVSDARVPMTESTARSTLRYLMAAAVLGTGAVTGLLLWLHIKADTIQTRRAAGKKLDAQVLVALPHEKQKPMMNGGNVSFYFRENIYRLRSRVETAAGDREDAVVILVTSVAANEGKSTVAANLALALAEKHKGVLLVDADLRNPSLLTMLGGKYAKEQGLGHLLTRNQLTAGDIAAAIGYQKDDNLMTILEKKAWAGATDLISGRQMIRLLNLLKKTVKYIVLDAPPVGLFPDGSVLSDMADQTVLVIRQDVVSACDINDAADALGQGKSGFLGCVLNDMRSVSGGGYGYGYGYGYGKGYGRGYGYGYGYGPKKKNSARGDEGHE